MILLILLIMILFPTVRGVNSVKVQICIIKFFSFLLEEFSNLSAYDTVTGLFISAYDMVNTG